MKLPTINSAILTALGSFALFSALSASVAAADFNPQPDPPGKSRTINDGQHNPPDDKVLHNPPSDKVQHNPPADRSADTRVLLPAVKPEKLKQLDKQKISAAQGAGN